MITRIFPQLLKNVFSRAFTNPSFAKHMPPSLTDALADQSSLNPNVPVKERFRGRLDLNKDKCVGCKLCIKVCPANAISYLPESKKVFIHHDRCCFCAQCTEICPPKCLAMSDVYMISTYDRREKVEDEPAKAAPPQTEPVKEA